MINVTKHMKKYRRHLSEFLCNKFYQKIQVQRFQIPIIISIVEIILNEKNGQNTMLLIKLFNISGSTIYYELDNSSSIRSLYENINKYINLPKEKKTFVKIRKEQQKVAVPFLILMAADVSVVGVASKFLVFTITIIPIVSQH